MNIVTSNQCTCWSDIIWLQCRDFILEKIENKPSLSEFSLSKSSSSSLSLCHGNRECPVKTTCLQNINFPWTITQPCFKLGEKICILYLIQVFGWFYGESSQPIKDHVIHSLIYLEAKVLGLKKGNYLFYTMQHGHSDRNTCTT